MSTEEAKITTSPVCERIYSALNIYLTMSLLFFLLSLSMVGGGKSASTETSGINPATVAANISSVIEEEGEPQTTQTVNPTEILSLSQSTSKHSTALHTTMKAKSSIEPTEHLVTEVPAQVSHTPNRTVTVSTSTKQPTDKNDERYRNLDRAMVIVFTPLGAVVATGVVIALIVYLRKKIKLDKLRHQLMPLYNFDPAAEDWETELLTESRDNNPATTEIKSPAPNDSPKLAFSTETLEI